MKQRFAFSAEPEDVEKFDKIAADEERSRSSFITYLIKETIKKQEQQDEHSRTD